MGDFEKKFPASACRKKKIACSTNVTESLWEKNILPTSLNFFRLLRVVITPHQIARKKEIRDDQKSNTPPPPPLKS